MRNNKALRAGLARLAALTAVVATVGLLPWLSGKDPALSVLRARSAEQEPTAEALAAVRRDLGLEAGPFALLGDWAGGLLRGELGTSWVSGAEVLPSVRSGLGVSLTLMAASLVVALLVASAVCAPALVRGARGTLRGGGGAAGAMLAAVPEFLLATVLLIVLGVWAGALPVSGWQGPEHLLLPALAMGVPAGGLLGRLVDDALPAVFRERWTDVWRASGVSRLRVVAAALRRALPALVPQAGLVVVGLTGGAVAVETVFAVPGLGRTALGAAKSQDLPLLQGCVLALLLLALAAGGCAALVRRRLFGAALKGGALTLPAPQPGRVRARVPAALAAVLLLVIGTGLLRDPYTVDTALRLADPSAAHPLGTDALGRDVLARLGHGATTTVGVALAVCAVSFVLALAIGFLPNAGAGLADIANALPPVIAGVLVAALTGPSTFGASLAVALISWPPLAAHAAALVQEVRASSHVMALRAIGAGPAWILMRHVLPAVAGPVARHAVLRLPGVALALAALGFLGLGAQPPSPEWGLLLDESRLYVERAPVAALAPAVALALLAALAVTLAGLRPRTRRSAVSIAPTPGRLVEQPVEVAS
ncbi:ABC transporter permease subunit [Streptomyces sp. TRM66268-LWL]|uniref:ABC transporter permease subunit n=1 Tax=Streptomyces polyasparticus TaxID=2767826 RepID=A0ABR7SL85_9ACTN|nr:ABC transporter permease subunit [Streptomyces polyasparticus]MBC9716240.1 ABC transporter permease subunit [Streptomyces polyasparticus]